MQNTDLALAAEDEIARRRLLPFAKAVAPQYTWAPPPRHIAYWLHLLELTVAGSIKKLLLIGPPGHAKSTCTQIAGAFFLLTQPGRKLVVVSAQEALAERNAKAMREIIREQKLWPNVSINAESHAALHFELSNNNKSECRVFSVNSIVTGHRADFVILDDPQPSPMTLGTRDTLENYLRGILESRLEPAAPVVMLSNRWSTDDLVARIEAGEDASDWVIVSLEALNESPDDPLHRELGEALWPEKWPVEVLLAKKRAVGSGVFNASYQGHPTPEGGRLFEPGWFGEYETLPSARALQRPTVQVYRSPLEAAHEPPQRFVRVTAVDAAGKSTQSGSYSAIVTLLYDGADIFVCAAERSREAFEELRARLISHYNRWQPDLIVIENMGGLGSQLIGSLKWSTRLPVRPVDPGRRSKEERALDVLPLCEAGRVFLPKHAVWKDFFVRELSDFPQGRNDDTVDAFVYALQYVMLVQRRRRVDEHWSKQLAKLNDGWVGR